MLRLLTIVGLLLKGIYLYKHLVFVYGTLKKGFSNHHFLKDQEYLGKAEIKGTMISLRHFPGVCLVGNDDILGEVYEINDETLKRLDHLEGHPSFYKRKEILAFYIDNLDQEVEANKAWCYTLPESYLQEGNHQRIPDGIWRKQA